MRRMKKMFRVSFRYPGTDGERRSVAVNIYMLVTAVVTGVIIGALAQGLKDFVAVITKVATYGIDPHGWNWQLVIAPGIGFMAAVVVQRFVLKRNVEHGTVYLDSLLAARNPSVSRKYIWGPFVASGLTLGFGGSAGSEGPIATIGGAVGSNVAKWCRMPLPVAQAMLAIGAGAGIAGIFKAPVAGMLFAVEVLGMGMSALQLLALAACCTTSSLTAYMLSGLISDVTFPVVTPVDFRFLPWALALGLFCGLYCVYYRRVARLTRAWLDRMGNVWLKAAVAGVIVGVLVSLMPRLYGEGYTFVTSMLSGDWHTLCTYGPFARMHVDVYGYMALALAIILVKSVAVTCTTSGGGVAGDFAPAIFAGCMVGFVFAMAANTFFGASLPVADMAFFGMAAVLGGAVRAPLMAMFLVVEMAMQYQLLLPTAIACAASFLVVTACEGKMSIVVGTSSGVRVPMEEDTAKVIVPEDLTR